MIDTVLNLGLNDESVLGLAERPATSASPGTPTGVSCRCTRNVVARCPERAVRGRDRRAQGRRGVTPRHRARRRRAARADRVFKRDSAQTGEEFPQDPRRPAHERDPRGLRLLERRPRGVLPQDQPHPRRLGYRRERAADGVRQQGREHRQRASRSAATRSPARPEPSGDFLINAQGEDVVSGVRTPQELAELARHDAPRPTSS